MKKSVATAVSALMVLAAGSAFAAEQKPVAPKGPEGREAHFAERFKKNDTNNDGAISKDEWRAKGDEMFKEIDANNDGKISQDEMKAHHQAQFEKWKEHRAEMSGGEKPVAPTGAPATASTTPEKK